MIAVTAVCVGLLVAVSIYMLLGRELKGIAMGVFLLSHAAHLSIIAMSGSPIIRTGGDAADVKSPPVLTEQTNLDDPLATMVDPLPQALILTAIVISFGVMGFLLALTVVTGRSANTLDVEELSGRDGPETSEPH
ncbi:MAG: sodium:proton antiporter [Phycisphaeraceae bacterium]